jgi:undecaprenyl-diphosphatase
MLPDWLIVVILGIIEGITEFIPVSSTGHLLLAGHFLQRPQSDLFYILIQSGAVLAVIPLFHKRIAMLLRWREAGSRDLNLKIFVAFAITCVGGLVLKKLGFKLPDETLPIALALIIGGFVFIAVERLLKGDRSDRITWTIVLVVAAGQLVAAAFPGASRSGSTIMLAMIFGATRVAATEFSFLVGIPTMLAAGALETYGELKDGGQEDWGLLALGFVVSAIVSFIAVKWLLRYVQSHTFVSFGIYRIILGLVLLFLLIK